MDLSIPENIVCALGIVLPNYQHYQHNKNKETSQHICKSRLVMCPRCHFSQCPMEFLSNSCNMANFTYLFDNFAVVLFSAVMCLWSTVFMELWQREEAAYQLQWNVKSLENTISLRPEFLEKATKKRYSPVSDKMEPYIPKLRMACNYIITVVSVGLLLVIVTAATFGVMVYRVTVCLMLIRSSNIQHKIIKGKFEPMVASISGAVMSGIFIFVFKSIYEKVAIELTNLENHRTHHAYYNALIYKSYALAFANNYSAIFYIAFFKGKFFTYPGDLEIFHYLGGLTTDVCDPAGCVVDLAILLIIIMVLKAFTNNIAQVFIPKLTRRFNESFSKVNKQDVIPQWEDEYLLAGVEETFIIGEYMDMVIQYGFVNFFIMGFPLAPLFALINNIFELRVDSSKVTKSYRRPVPTRVTGLGAWTGILQATTYIGVVTNALVIAFTSDFMEKMIWRVTHGSKGGYLNQTLSVFDMKDFKMLDSSSAPASNQYTQKHCYYQGKRYPPGHPLKYKRRTDFWHHLCIKFMAVVVFEHIVIILKGFIAYAIPDVPFSVKQQIAQQEKLAKRAEMLEMNQEYLKKSEAKRKDVEAKRRKKKEEEEEQS